MRRRVPACPRARVRWAAAHRVSCIACRACSYISMSVCPRIALSDARAVLSVHVASVVKGNRIPGSGCGAALVHGARRVIAA
ncbi:hypothetical protein A8H32_21935 [Burkholderia thailandensis]|nr:hypothetical protein AQ475_25665 [Burkholderia thailandensis]AVR27677.1 hypothetical protein A8H32_21935 [Burkholderia thailandensis]